MVELIYEFGYILDLVIIWKLDNFISGWFVFDILFLDYLILLFKLKIVWLFFKVGCVLFRKLWLIDKDVFMDEICNSEFF